MEKIGFVFDEGADLPEEIIKEHQVAIVRFKMDWPDLESMPGENTFQKMKELEKKETKSFGKTSQPSPKDFLEAFKYQLDRFEKVLCVTISSKLSGTYNSAIQASLILEPEGKRIFIVDSLNATSGEGLVVLKTIDLVKEGRMVEEIVEELKKFIFKINLYGMVEDPKWLEASGRISHAVADWVRKMQKLGLRPILGMKEGLVKPIGIKAGAKDIPTALFNQLKAKTEKLRKQGKKIRVAITHADDPSGAQRLKETIERELEGVQVSFVTLVDNVLGIIVGPGCLVLSWAEI